MTKYKERHLVSQNVNQLLFKVEKSSSQTLTSLTHHESNLKLDGDNFEQMSNIDSKRESKLCEADSCSYINNPVFTGGKTCKK